MSCPDGRTLFRAWQLCTAAGLDLFAPDAARGLPSLPGWAALRLPITTPVPSSIVEALRAIELARHPYDGERSAAKLAVTHPGPGRRLPSIRDVARTLLQTSQRELLIVGYSITDPTFSEQLVQRGLSGVAVTVVCERTQRGGRDLVASWPARARPLRVLQGVEPDLGRTWIMHGKVVVSDRREALVGSANFTRGGLANNIEIGCHLAGGMPEQICRFIEGLESEGWLEPVLS